MAFTSTDLDAVRAAIAKGELSVQFGDRRTQYRSIDELLQAEAHIAQALASASTSRSKQSYGVAGKGL